MNKIAVVFLLSALARGLDRAELVVIDGENHTITRRRSEVVSQTVRFFRSVFGIRS